MKKPFRLFCRIAASLLAAALLLQLTGCSWFFMPGPVIITDEETRSAADGTYSTEEEPSGSVSESTTPPGTPADADTAEAASSGDESAGSSSAVPADESSPEESGWHNQSAGSSEESTEAPLSFAVDYFRTPECLHAVASDAVFVDAYNVISACIAYKTSAKVSCAKEEAARVIYIADTLCPLLKAFTDISEDSWADGEMNWEFYVDKVAFAIIRSEFEAQVAAYIAPVLDPVYSETERALLLYHAYTEPACYNYEIISGTFNTRTEAEKHRIHSAFAGIMDHTGVCHDLAGGMTFLFIQAGFNACRISVITRDDEHSWTLIELDGRYTCCDATWDVGGSFCYFGTSAAERTERIGGSFRLEDMNIYDLNAPENFDIKDPGFGRIQSFSRRIGTGIRLSLSFDTAVSPHRLIFTGPSGARLEISCP